MVRTIDENEKKTKLGQCRLVCRETNPLPLSFVLSFFCERRTENGPVSSPRTTFGCAKTFRGVVVLIGDTAAAILKFRSRERVVVVETLVKDLPSSSIKA